MPLNGERLRSRHPFELFMLVVAFIYSMPGLVFADIRPGSIQATVGPVGTIAWSVALCIGTGGALLGIFGFAKDRATGLTWEACGCLSAGSATVYYAAVVVYANGPRSVFSAVVMCGFGAACLARTYQLQRLLRRASARAADRREG
jgi:hypothetical protein